MKLTFETDTLLYQILKAAPELEVISGGVYAGDRPDNSDKEDVSINTITLSQDSVPQTGSSNVNIHVSDLNVQIAGRIQKKANTERLKSIAVIVLDVLRAARVDGLGFRVMNQTTFKEPDLDQHYVNLRIDWSIH